MPFLSKKRITFYLLPILMLALFLLLPEIAHAETIQGTLRDNEQIKNLHNGLMNIINIPIILIIVAMAFAEMLRFKIDTYGFKKVLPTLLLAIIAAQFSYLICKMIIDLANMTILLFLDPKFLGDASSLPAKYAATFSTNLFSPGPDWPNFTYAMFFDLLLQILFMFAGSVLILVLCFLFLVRSWMIYLLVIISGAAFMMLAFPPTKTYFNKWWSEFLKWTFLPVPSVFFLWLGALFLKNPIVTSSWLSIPFMSAIIAIACLVAAITMPFKMGGPIMAKFWQYSGAQFATKKAKDYWGRRAKATVGLGWERFRRVGLDMQREGKTTFSRWLGKNWIGTGGDKLAADEAHISKLAKGTSEGIQARHNFNKGDRRAMEIEWTKNRGGEIGEFENYGLGKLMQRGIDNPNDPIYAQLKKWRVGSGAARAKMAATTSMENGLITQGQFLWFSGGGDRKDFETKKEYEKRQEEYRKYVGVTSKESEDFHDFFWAARSQEETAKAGMEKMLNDASVKPSLKETQIHERQLIYQMLNEIDKATEELSADGQQLVKYLQSTGKSFNQLSQAEKQQHQAIQVEVDNIISKTKRAEHILYSQNILKRGQNLIHGETNWQHSRALVNENREEIIKDLNDNQVIKKGRVDPYLQNLVKMENGRVVDLNILERVVYTRKKGVAMSKTDARAQKDYANRSTEENVDVFFHSDEKDGLTEEKTRRIREGRVVLDSNGESRIVANAEALRKKLYIESTSEEAVHNILNEGQAEDGDVFSIASKWILEEVKRPDHRKDPNSTAAKVFTQIEAAASRGDIAALRPLMQQYYTTYQKNSDRTHLNNAVDNQLFPGEPT